MISGETSHPQDEACVIIPKTTKWNRNTEAFKFKLMYVKGSGHEFIFLHEWQYSRAEYLETVKRGKSKT